MTRLPSVLALLGLGVLWGLTIPLTRVAVSTGHQPPGLIFWQLVIVSSLLGAVAAMRRRRPRLSRRFLSYYAVIALLGTLLPNSFSYLAAARLPAGVMSIVIASVPMFALAISLVIGLERPSLRRTSGVLSGAVAVLLLIAPDSLPDPGTAVYILVALVAPLCYGVEGNYIATRRPADADPIDTLLGASLIGCVIAGPFALASGTWIDPAAPWGDPERALVLQALCHAMAYTGYVWLVGRTGPVFASQIGYVVTLSGTSLSMLMLGESYSDWVWLALALMMAGLALVRPRHAGEPQGIESRRGQP